MSRYNAFFETSGLDDARKRKKKKVGEKNVGPVRENRRGKKMRQQWPLYPRSGEQVNVIELSTCRAVQ